jgi:NifU-like protein involved in Fe-S cluster formation
MLNDIYNKRILGFAADIPRHARLADPHGTAVAHSRLCGSKVTVDVKMDGPLVADFGHEVKACALGQASSSIMARNVVGSTADELNRIRREMHAMLKENGTPPTGRWSDLEALLPVRDFKARHASTLLTFDAVCEAVDKAMKGSSASPAAMREESATAGRGS